MRALATFSLFLLSIAAAGALQAADERNRVLALEACVESLEAEHPGTNVERLVKRTSTASDTYELQLELDNEAETSPMRALCRVRVRMDVAKIVALRVADGSWTQRFAELDD